jgi:hypothetical protein
VIAAKRGRHEQQAVVMGRNLSLAVVWSTLRWTALCVCACVSVRSCVRVCVCDWFYTLPLPDVSVSLKKKLLDSHNSHQWLNPCDRDLCEKLTVAQLVLKFVPFKTRVHKFSKTFGAILKFSAPEASCIRRALTY